MPDPARINGKDVTRVVVVHPTTAEGVNPAAPDLPSGAATAANQAAAIGYLAPASACAVTSVGDETTSTELLAENLARKSARIVNDSTAVLYVACTEAASATNFTARLEQYDAVTIEGFTGAIFGLWASDAGGNARVSEFT